jgi:hypothetical protein
VLHSIAFPVVSVWYQYRPPNLRLRVVHDRFLSAHIGSNSHFVLLNDEPLPLPRTSRTLTSARCWWTNFTAIDPSPTAEDTRLIEPLRTSPAANTPGRFVSKGYGSRPSPAQTSPSSAERSHAPPVWMKPIWSSPTVPSSQRVLASAPTNKNNARAPRVRRAPERVSSTTIPFR